MIQRAFDRSEIPVEYSRQNTASDVTKRVYPYSIRGTVGHGVGIDVIGPEAAVWGVGAAVTDHDVGTAAASKQVFADISDQLVCVEVAEGIDVARS